MMMGWDTLRVEIFQKSMQNLSKIDTKSFKNLVIGFSMILKEIFSDFFPKAIRQGFGGA